MKPHISLTIYPPDKIPSLVRFSSPFLALALSFFLFSTVASAHINNTPAASPALQIDVGFEDDSRLDYWTPVQISVSNQGADFKGILSATTYTSPFPSGQVVGAILPWSYQEPITLPHGAQKQITMNVPFYESPSVPRGIIATLRNSRGKVVATQNKAPYTLRPGALLVGTLSADDTGYSPLDAVSLPDPSRTIERARLNAATMPDMAEMLGNFDVIILDNFTTGSLNTGQLAALQTWINQGGALIEVGGPQWQRTLGPLPPALLPVIPQGIATIPAGTPLLSAGSPTIADTGQTAAPDTLRKPVAISTAIVPGKDDARQRAFSSIETVLAYGSTPLIVQARQGRGVICYLAFDPLADPLVTWPGTIALWKGLLFRTLGDQFLIPGTVPRYNLGPGQLLLRAGLLQVLQPGTLFLLVEIAFLLLSYIILIGPVRLVIVRRLKRPDWNWRVILSSVLVFSLLTYGLAYYQQRASINSISFIQLDQGGSSAHVTTYLSVFTPGRGNFQVHLPARRLVQPINSAPFLTNAGTASSNDQTTIAPGRQETNVNLQDTGLWTLHPFVSEGDQQVYGGLSSHLVLRDNTLVGTVTNTLETSLSDVYILMPKSLAYIGSLPAGQTQQVNIALHNVAPNTGMTLADQIARDNHLPAPYFPYASSSQPQNDFQRHIAILSALSGEGVSTISCQGMCSTHAIASDHMLVAALPGGPKVNTMSAGDPLLVAGAPATLIGWSNQSLDALDNATVNGITPGGFHDNLVQAPLNIDFTGSSNLQPNLITAHVINSRGSEAQTTSPGVYTLTTGTITFEFTLPWETNPQLSSITIAEPYTGQLTDMHLQVRLYNWQTGSWDAITLNQYTSFTTGYIGTYISSDGRILLQFANQNTFLGTLLFSKPSISLRGTASGS
jgi:hypothetical protein